MIWRAEETSRHAHIALLGRDRTVARSPIFVRNRNKQTLSVASATVKGKGKRSLRRRGQAEAQQDGEDDRFPPRHILHPALPVCLRC